MKQTLIVVDCQNDFISGSLACNNADISIKHIIKFINTNANDLKVYYSLDWHKPTNKSFKLNGGIWPIHCVQEEKGSKLSTEFEQIQNKALQPNENTKFLKGIKDDIEEYSAYNAQNIHGENLKNITTNNIIVCGIASEFCVKETALEFMKAGHIVSLLKNGIGYVDYNNHQKTITDLEKQGIKII